VFGNPDLPGEAIEFQRLLKKTAIFFFDSAHFSLKLHSETS
jgi:hypothetical protein